MTQPYYDAKRLKRIAMLYKTDPWLGQQLMSSYVSEYPYDFLARSMYVRMSIIILDLEEAKASMKENLEVFQSYRKSHLPQDTIDIFKREMLYHLIRITILEKDYATAQVLVMNNKNLFATENYEVILTNLEKELGFISDDRSNQMRYLKRQILEYNYDDFRKHILKHLQDSCKIKNNAVFRNSFPLDKVLEELPNLLQNQNRYTTNLLTDTYQFQYDGCGYIGRKNADAFLAVMLHDTNQIITMYPTLNYSKEHAVDMNALNGSQNPELVLKRKTQIAKFYERYPKIT